MALEYQSPHPENKSSTQNRVQRSSLLEYDVSTTILWNKLFLEEQGYLFSMKEIFSIRSHLQRAHISLLADPPGSQVSGALLFSWNALKTPPVVEEKCS
jgi:hypothetical protein